MIPSFHPLIGRTAFALNDFQTEFIPAVVYERIYFSPSACIFSPGDVNNNGVFNGIDIAYSVNYLKGSGQSPIYICDCDQSQPVFAAADANGNCTFNGIDVVYMIAYLKGAGYHPIRCFYCPTQ